MGNEVTEYKIAKEVFALGRDIILTDEAQDMKNYTQHGTTSVFEHVLAVAKFSLIFAINLENVFGVRVDRKALVRGALLHDYFLYDWHTKDPSHSLHGFHHARTALLNATRDFELGPIERNMIDCHMFPLNMRTPRYRESWLLIFSDRLCSGRETVTGVLHFPALHLSRVSEHLSVPSRSRFWPHS